MARANVLRLLAEEPYGPEDLNPERGPVLVTVALPDRRNLDVVTDAGLRSVKLPQTYPLDQRGRVVDPGACQPIGDAARAAGISGVAARSAAPGAWPSGEELAHFYDGASSGLKRASVAGFDDWFWPAPGEDLVNQRGHSMRQ